MPTYSLWLQPSGRCAAVLQEEIDRLSKEYGGPSFTPHVTLLGGFEAEEREVLDKTMQLSQQLQPYTLHLEEVQAGTLYFQCVYVLVRQDAAVIEAWRQACAAFSMPHGGQSYMPHLSLLYSDVDERIRRSVVDLASHRLHGAGVGTDAELSEFSASALHLWETPEDKGVASWRLIRSVPLQAAAV
ncbi:hypothetical protein WJX72_003748 [[Myrmecia] bisecta]|uniref:RNA ligase/cyclic nucleotide phosphodiesterase family protein n=1 Tax=[Myrmecia] bisecta TaxID=41462 RepID=A0AAW1PHA3_9CHLO